MPKTKKSNQTVVINTKPKDKIVEAKETITVSNEENIKIKEETAKDKYTDKLLFLEKDYRKKVIDEITNIQIRVGKRLHHRLTEFRNDIKQYKKDLRESERSTYFYPYGRNTNMETDTFGQADIL